MSGKSDELIKRIRKDVGKRTAPPYMPDKVFTTQKGGGQKGSSKGTSGSGGSGSTQGHSGSASKD